MKQLKKTLLTLVALLAVTTGAWAQTETLLTTITATGTEQASYSTANVATVSFSNLPDNSSHYSDTWGWWGYGFTATVTAAEGYTITKCVFYDNDGATATDSTDPFIVETEEDNKKPKVNGATFGAFTSAGIKTIEVYGYVTPSASTGPEVAWNKAEKTGTFKMPGGNVTLEPEYYPQATAAEGAVTAATDAKATTDAPLVTIDETKLTGATKMMYYVSTDATAPAYDAEGWTDVLPTAEKFTEAANLNVWYYPVGTDEGVGEATATYSDGDICALPVTLGAAPLWNAEFDLTNAPEEDKAGKWSTDIPEGGVVKGQTVTVTYTGTKKVIGVKAEKKAAAPAKPLANATAEDLGKIAGADGNIYDTKAAAEAANTTAVAMIAYVGNNTDHATYTHGLAIALADEEGQMNWNPAKSTCEGKSAVTNAAWQLPSQNQWKAMFKAFGDNDASYSGLNTAITNAGGTVLLGGNYYWSSTPDGAHVFCVSIDNGSDIWQYGYVDEDSYDVRACLAF